MSEFSQVEETVEATQKESGEKISSKSKEMNASAEDMPKQTQAPTEQEDVSSKSRLATVLLTFFFGEWGVDLFYKGKIGLGIFQACLGLLSAIIKFPFVFIVVLVGWVPLSGWLLALVLLVLLLFLSLPGWIWPGTRLILALCGSSTDKQGKKIKKWKN